MCDYETMDEMDSMQYKIDELEEKLEKIKDLVNLTLTDDLQNRFLELIESEN